MLGSRQQGPPVAQVWGRASLGEPAKRADNCQMLPSTHPDYIEYSEGAGDLAHLALASKSAAATGNWRRWRPASTCCRSARERRACDTSTGGPSFGTTNRPAHSRTTLPSHLVSLLERDSRCLTWLQRTQPSARAWASRPGGSLAMWPAPPPLALRSLASPP